MRKLILVAGVAGLAITTPAAAKPDKGDGGGGHEQVQRGGNGGGGGNARAQRGGGGGGQAQAQHGGGEARAQRGGGGGQAQRMERRGGGGDRQAQRMERRGGERQAQRNERQAPQMERRQQQRFANLQSERGNRNRAQRVERNNNRQQARLETGDRGNQRRFEQAQREQHNNRFERQGREQRVERVAIDQRQFRDRSDVRIDRGDRSLVQAFVGDNRDAFRDGRNYRDYDQWRDWNDGDWDRAYARRGIPAAYVGCPPGLAKKSIACVPPGQARQQFVGSVLPNYYASNYMPLGLRDIYYDTPDYYYRWGDGYAYRVNRSDNLVAALLPLIGAGYGVGQYFPYQNEPNYYVPSYYQSFYPNYGDDYYRYANGYVYEVDGRSGMVEDVIPLLDRGYGIGQVMPAGYSYYNVPYQYRDYYYDTDDTYYRYAPGAIYQVDANSQLITSVAALLTGGLSVGQPLPPAYSVYNVPMSYRDRYYDSPDSMYRYSDGYIYQVDPTTRLITAMVQALV
jgi:hypothetical protein